MKFKNYQDKKKDIAGKIVIGIDPGKEKHQAAIVNEHGIQVGNPFTFKVSSTGFNITLWKKIEQTIGRYSPDNMVFAVETSCNLWVTIVDYLIRKGYRVLLISPLTTHHSRPLIDHDYSKTDPKDALLIGTNAYNGNYDYYQIYSEDTKRLHQLSITYDKLMKDRTTNRMRIRSIMEVAFPEYLECIDVCTESSLYILSKYFMPEHFMNMDVMEEGKVIKRLSMNNYDEGVLIKIQQMAKNSIGADRKEEGEVLRLTLDSYIMLYRKLNEQMELINEKMIEIARKSVYFKVITSVKGISDTSAARFMGECRVFDELNYSHFKQIEKLAGSNLRLKQSGKYVGARHISHIGNKRLLKLLYLMTTQVVRYIPEVRCKFLKRQMRNRFYRKNIIACTSQLLKVLIALLKDKRPYELYMNKYKEMKDLEDLYKAIRSLKEGKAA